MAEYMKLAGLRYGFISIYTETIFLKQEIHNGQWTLFYSRASTRMPSSMPMPSGIGYAQSTEYGRFPLVVLQALLFASCPYIAVDTLKGCGFRGKSDARNCLYKRAKLLFHLDAAGQPLAQAQAAVLLSLHASAAEPRAGSEWLTLAIQRAHTLDSLPGLSAPVDPLHKKRLWWSIILRDRYLCLTLHRRTQMPEIHSSLDVDSLGEGFFAHEMAHSRVYDPETKRLLLRILNEHYRLALALSDMMSLVYSTHEISANPISGCAFETTIANIKRVKDSLEEWKSSTKLAELVQGTTHATAMLFANLIQMYYYAARISLAHFELLTIERHPGYIYGYDAMLSSAGNDLYSSVSEQTTIMELLGQRGKDYVLPLSVLGCLPMPLITTAINISLSTSPYQMAIHKRSINTLGQVIRYLEQVYEAAAMISAGISHFLQLAYITIQLRSTFDGQPLLSPSSAISDADADTNTDAVDRKHANAQTWKDFLSQSPRVYLLLSTTVDYSLSLGHLPRTNSLPDLLTCLLPGSLRISLPWDVIPDSSGSRQRPAFRDRSRVKMVRRVRKQQDARPNEVNLDYMDLGAG